MVVVFWSLFDFFCRSAITRPVQLHDPVPYCIYFSQCGITFRIVLIVVAPLQNVIAIGRRSNQLHEDRHATCICADLLRFQGVLTVHFTEPSSPKNGYLGCQVDLKYLTVGSTSMFGEPRYIWKSYAAGNEGDPFTAGVWIGSTLTCSDIVHMRSGGLRLRFRPALRKSRAHRVGFERVSFDPRGLTNLMAKIPLHCKIASQAFDAATVQ